MKDFTAQTKELIDNLAEELNLLEKSILSKAFRGELGTNSPDEPNFLSGLKNKSEQLKLLRV